MSVVVVLMVIVVKVAVLAVAVKSNLCSKGTNLRYIASGISISRRVSCNCNTSNKVVGIHLCGVLKSICNIISDNDNT